MNILKGFALAFNMLTIIPIFKIHNYFNGINGISAVFYPTIGAIVGAILYAISFLNLPQIHLGVIIFSMWVLITGALHLDGLSDTIDGLFVDKTKSLNVMKDSHIGGMGMIFSTVFLMLKASSVIFLPSYNYLIAILAFSRFNAVLAIYFFPYISSGVTKLIKDELKLKHLLFSFLSVLVIALYFNLTFLLILSAVFSILIALFFKHRLGGLNGDIYGTIIELSELFMLNYLIL